MLAREIVAPRYLSRPEWTASAGDEVADLAAQCGLDLDAEQRLILDVMFAERGDRWAAREVGVILPRQTGKTVTFEAACLGDLFLYGGPEQLVIWTAHLFPTANEAFIDLKAIIDGSSFLSRRVRRITEAAGNQGIELVDGTRLKFLARSKSGGRGFSGAKVYLDEGFALTAAEIGSLLPTLSAQPNPQVVYGSSAGRRDSDVLRRVRDRGRAGGDPSLAYLEWCADQGECGNVECVHEVGAESCLLDDRERWLQANPTMGVRVDEEFIASERLAMEPVEFARERLGWWEDPPEFGVDDVLSGWHEAVTEAAPSDPVALGVDVSSDGRSAAIVACGGGVVEVVEYRRGSGIGWVADRVAEVRARNRVSCVGIAAASPAATLEAHIPDVVVVSSSAMATASQSFAQDINDRRLAHRGQAPLDISVAAAVRQLSGDGWRWSRRLSRADISPLVGAVVAAHLAGGERAPMSTEELLKSFG